MFNYTITDGDGDTSPSTLTITVNNGQPFGDDGERRSVDEAALDLDQDRADLAAGTVTGVRPRARRRRR